MLREIQFSMALFDQCSCGPTLHNEFVRKRSHFQSSHVFHHLHKLCPGEHKHLNLRGAGLAAAAALYPSPECKQILILLEALLPTDARERGRSLLSNDTPVHTFEKCRGLKKSEPCIQVHKARA